MRKTYLSLFRFSILLFFLCICDIAQSQKTVPVPSAADGFRLRVIYAENPRLQKLNEETVRSILSWARAIAKESFSIRIDFELAEPTTIDRLFAVLSPTLRQQAQDATLNPIQPESQMLLARSLLLDLKSLEGNLNEIRKFASPHLLAPPKDTSEYAFADAVARTQLEQLRYWYSLPALDGRPIIRGDGYNEYMQWIGLGHALTPYEVIITNQLIASSEKAGNSVHSALRGGVSNGLTASSRKSRTGAFSVLSTYPFFMNDPVTARMRNGTDLASNDAIRYAGALLAHELGHQLLHLGHPFDNKACVMRPPERLLFQEWFADLAPLKCPLGSSPQMTPGKVVRFPEIRDSTLP